MVSQLHKRVVKALADKMDGDTVKIPEGSGIVWEAFQRMSRARSAGANGPNPISFPEIEAWCRLTRTPLEPHHVAIIEAMDDLWMGRAYQRKDAPEGAKVAPLTSKAPLSPALFDAGFN